MKSDFRSIGEFVAVVSVVLSLIFVGIELRLNRSVAANDSFAQSSESATSLYSAISDHASIWRRGCIGEELSEDDDVIFTNLVTMTGTFYFSRWRRALDGITNANPDLWTMAVAQNMYRFSGFRDKWRQTEKYGPGTSIDIGRDNNWVIDIENTLTKLEQSGDDRNISPSFCGR